MSLSPNIPLPSLPLLVGRQEFIVAHCVQKHVLHLGCVDTGLLEERFSTGELLHQKLAQVTDVLWGLDINEDGLQFLRERGFTNLLHGDVCHLNKLDALYRERFDVIIASELIEHLPNPGLFLEGVQSLMVPAETDLLISVPNAFRIDTLLRLLKRVEYVHPDHNYWFSYHTIRNLVEKSGLTIIDTYLYTFSSNFLPLFARKYRSEINTSTTNSLAAYRRERKRPSLSWRNLSAYIRSLPKRLLATFLFSRTPFFADGLIIRAQSPTEKG